jgi:hypothetical protein
MINARKSAGRRPIQLDALQLLWAAWWAYERSGPTINAVSPQVTGIFCFKPCGTRQQRVEEGDRASDAIITILLDIISIIGG